MENGKIIIKKIKAEKKELIIESFIDTDLLK